KLLPDPAELYRPRPYRVVERPSVLVPLEPRPRRRWPRTVALAALVFGAGAASGDLLRDRHPAESGALELRTAAPAAPALTGPGGRQARPNSAPHQAPRRASSRASAPAARRAPEQSWAVNVIGVAAQVTGPRVSLVWQRPAGSAHVVVLRALGDRQRGTVVFRGHATSFRDDPPPRVHLVPLHDRQLRPARAPVDGCTDVGRYRRLHVVRPEVPTTTTSCGFSSSSRSAVSRPRAPQGARPSVLPLSHMTARGSCAGSRG